MQSDCQIYKNISFRFIYSKQLPNYVAWIHNVLIAKENNKQI